MQEHPYYYHPFARLLPTAAPSFPLLFSTPLKQHRKRSMLSILGICASSEERERRQRSIQIDRELEQDLEKQRKEIKILLLGSGESGKSTIVKQIKIIHQGGFTDAELESWRPIIYKNLVDSAKDLITSAQKLEQNFRNAKNNEVHTTGDQQRIWKLISCAFKRYIPVVS